MQAKNCAFHHHAGLIDALGGPTATAQAVSEAVGKAISQPRVSMWKHRGIPHEFRPLVARLLISKRKRALIPEGFIPGSKVA